MRPLEPGTRTRQNDYEHRPALELVQSIKAKEERILELLGELEALLEDRG